MELVIYARIDEFGAIGHDKKIPFDLNKDSERFDSLTTRHGVIMGRKAANSYIDHKIEFPFKDRYNVVIGTKDEMFDGEGDGRLLYTSSIGYGIERACNFNKDGIGFIIGGASLYRHAMALPETSRLEITRFNQTTNGETRFPIIDDSVFKLAKLEKHLGDRVTFETWERR